MHTLIVTPMLPLQSRADMAGTHRRNEVAFRALAEISSRLHILQIVPENLMPLARDQAALNRSQSGLWGVDLHVTLVPRATRQQTLLNHYALGIINPAAQPNLFPYLGPAQIAAVARALDENPGCVYADRLESVMAVRRTFRRPRLLVYDTVDIHHVVLQRRLALAPPNFGTYAMKTHLPALQREERRATEAASLTFVCSDADADHLRAIGARGEIRVVPNAMPAPAAPPGLTARRTVLFLGSFHHPPNRAAADRLLHKIWPIIIGQMPEAELLIAGAGSEDLAAASARLHNVRCLGFVDDVAALYADSRLTCTPIDTGSGTRLKLVEAASYARPMVSTALGAEGLAFQDGESILLRETDADIATACLQLLQNDALCARLGQAAREVMLSHYDAAAITAKIAQHITTALR